MIHSRTYESIDKIENPFHPTGGVEKAEDNVTIIKGELHKDNEFISICLLLVLVSIFIYAFNK